jgi:four helix bundle protein
MADSAYAKSFEELIVYQRAAGLALRLFQLSKTFPKEETYSLTSQLRRASRSIGAQIAEAWGKRRYPRHFVSKLTDADAEQLETRHWIHVATSCGYLRAEQQLELIRELSAIGRMLHVMVHKASSFCTSKDSLVRESEGEYAAVRLLARCRSAVS